MAWPRIASGTAAMYSVGDQLDLVGRAEPSQGPQSRSQEQSRTEGAEDQRKPGGHSQRTLNRPGFDAASFLAKDADHGEEVSHRAAGARDPDGG